MPVITQGDTAIGTASTLTNDDIHHSLDDDLYVMN